MNQKIPFVKATAYGNDFILIDGHLLPVSELHQVTQRICDRHLGVGADGVEWLFESKDADVEARLINSDGSDAEVSGNGTRCVAAWMVKKQLMEYKRPPEDLDELLTSMGEEGKPREVRVLTGAGIKTCTLTGHSGTEFTFRSDMGKPLIEGELTLQSSRGQRKGIKLSMGNPQFIVFVDDFSPDWQKEAAEIESHPAFPHRTNVEFVKVIGPHEIEIRIYERGAAETMSSGTGSCAAAVAAIHTSRLQSPVRVLSPGGPQTVEWDDRVWLTGPARILCQGEFFL